MDGAETALTERLRGLIDAGIALGLSLDDLLQKLVETASEFTGARYAALGVIDGTGTELARFLTMGIDPRRTPRSVSCHAGAASLAS